MPVLTKINTNALSDSAVTSAKVRGDVIAAGDLAPNSVDSSELVNGAVDLAHMSVNSVDSDQYVDGSIDNAHLADDAVGTDELANDVVISTSGAITTTGAFTSIGIDDNSNALAMTIDASENVGIGTTAPETKLTIDQSSDNNALRIYAYDDMAADYGEIYLDDVGYLNVVSEGSRSLNLRSGSSMNLKVNENSTAITALHIKNDGKVGIGTTAPATALHVNSGTAAPMTLEITDTNGDFTLKSTASTPSGTIIGLRWEAKDDAGNNTVYGIIGCNVDDDSNGSEKGSISFNLANAAGGTTEQMTIEGDGKVGIGVSNPNQSLEVRGTGIRTRRTGSSTQAVPAGVQLTTFAGNWPTVGHEVFRQQGMTLVGSGGGRIRVPVAYQANLNTHWYIKLTGCAANYNSRTSNGFSGEVWGGHLSVFNINHTSVFGHLGSISGSTGSSGGNHYVNFNFNSNYDSNGAWVWWECVGQTQSIYAPNMNGMAFG